MITRGVVNTYAVIPQKRPTGIIFFCWFKGTHYIVSTRNCGYYSKEGLFRGNKEISSQFWIMNRSHFCPTLGCNKNVLFGMDFSVCQNFTTLTACLMIFNVCFFTLWVLFLFQIITSIWTSKRSMAYMENLIECLSKPCWPGALLLPVNWRNSLNS